MSARLQKEFKALQKSPVPLITARPLDTNVFEWHYILTGPKDTPYEGGEYHGKLIFPSSYPFKPPSIMMITPSGRFSPNTRLCLSMSDFHPETWNPSWTVGTILNGLLSFMLESELTTGSIKTSDDEKRQFALDSKTFNRTKNPGFKKVFAELCK